MSGIWDPTNERCCILVLFFNSICSMNVYIPCIGSRSGSGMIGRRNREVSIDSEMDNGKDPERFNQSEDPKILLSIFRNDIPRGRYICNDLHNAGVPIAVYLHCLETAVNSNGASDVSLTAYGSGRQ